MVANIIIDLNHRDKLLYGDIKIIDNKTIQILRRSEAWARDQYVYAQIEFNVPLNISKYTRIKKIRPILFWYRTKNTFQS
jgi:hypothetical protein